LVTFFDQLSLEDNVILDDAIVHDDNASAAIAVWMGVLLARTTVRGPTSVADSVGSVEWMKADDLFQISQLALGATNLQAVPVAANRNSRRVIASIFEAAQTLDDDRDNTLLSDVSDDAAHGMNSWLGGGNPGLTS
jgi:hypothetical protein